MEKSRLNLWIDLIVLILYGIGFIVAIFTENLFLLTLIGVSFIINMLSNMDDKLDEILKKK